MDSPAVPAAEFLSPQQQKRAGTFTRWVNHILGDGQLRGLRELSSPALLLRVVNVVLGREMPVDFDVGVIDREGHMKNMVNVAEAMTKAGLAVDMTAEALLNGDPAALLRLVWLLVRRYYLNTVLGSKVYTSTAIREYALEKTRELLEPQSITVTDMSSCWESGVAFRGVLLAFEPNAIPAPSKKQPAPVLSATQILDQSFALAMQELGVPRLLEAADFARARDLDGSVNDDEGGADEQSVITYLCAFFHNAVSVRQRREQSEVTYQSHLAARERREKETQAELDKLTREIQEGMRAQEQTKEQLKKLRTENSAMAAEIARLARETEEHRGPAQEGKTEAERLLAAMAEEAVAHADRIALLHALIEQTETEFSGETKKSVAMSRQLEGLQRQVEFAEADREAVRAGGGEAEHTVVAPHGWLTIMFSNVDYSQVMWEENPDVMQEAVTIHNRIMRQAIARHNGYEVKTEGDAFMTAFDSCGAAIACALQVQMALMDAPWPERLLSFRSTTHAEMPDLFNPAEPLYRGLRVRMGIHAGTPKCVPDPHTGRMDYFGQMVNRAARVNGAACGGQILITDTVWQDCKSALLTIGSPVCHELGYHRFKGIAHEVLVHQVLPQSLSARTFPPINDGFELKEAKLTPEAIAMREATSELQRKIRGMERRFVNAQFTAGKCAEKMMDLYKAMGGKPGKNVDRDAEIAMDMFQERVKHYEALKLELASTMPVLSQLDEDLEKGKKHIAERQEELRQLQAGDASRALSTKTAERYLNKAKSNMEIETRIAAVQSKIEVKEDTVKRMQQELADLKRANRIKGENMIMAASGSRSIASTREANKEALSKEGGGAGGGLRRISGEQPLRRTQSDESATSQSKSQRRHLSDESHLQVAASYSGGGARSPTGRSNAVPRSSSLRSQPVAEESAAAPAAPTSSSIGIKASRSLGQVKTTRKAAPASDHAHQKPRALPLLSDDPVAEFLRDRVAAMLEHAPAAPAGDSINRAAPSPQRDASFAELLDQLVALVPMTLSVFDVLERTVAQALFSQLRTRHRAAFTASELDVLANRLGVSAEPIIAHHVHAASTGTPHSGSAGASLSSPTVAQAHSLSAGRRPDRRHSDAGLPVLASDLSNSPYQTSSNVPGGLRARAGTNIGGGTPLRRRSLAGPAPLNASDAAADTPFNTSGSSIALGEDARVSPLLGPMNPAGGEMGLLRRGRASSSGSSTVMRPPRSPSPKRQRSNEKLSEQGSPLAPSTPVASFVGESLGMIMADYQKNLGDGDGESQERCFERVVVDVCALVNSTPALFDVTPGSVVNTVEACLRGIYARHLSRDELEQVCQKIRMVSSLAADTAFNAMDAALGAALEGLDTSQPEPRTAAVHSLARTNSGSVLGANPAVRKAKKERREAEGLVAATKGRKDVARRSSKGSESPSVTLVLPESAPHSSDSGDVSSRSDGYGNGADSFKMEVQQDGRPPQAKQRMKGSTPSPSSNLVLSSTSSTTGSARTTKRRFSVDE